MKGETVLLRTRREAGRDEANDVVWEYDPAEEVADVLVGPPASGDDADSTRPAGVRADFDLLFPRAWPHRSLRGADVYLRGDPTPYHVVGDPLPVDGGMTPTRWNLVVPITRTEG